METEPEQTCPDCGIWMPVQRMRCHSQVVEMLYGCDCGRARIVHN